ncbi:hypothetical protein JWG40_07845 [Leptospira sp. 201903074]|uniref:hypothetical protein n=1 Tax=Leptospira abararensis TaxID=2810036 RepID=UPI0019645C75|nr:hypothetical protein [Leptospira abararensis]MBM9546925.1 hypothetical protein [Leptospira abararensis]
MDKGPGIVYPKTIDLPKYKQTGLEYVDWISALFIKLRLVLWFGVYFVLVFFMNWVF